MYVDPKNKIYRLLKCDTSYKYGVLEKVFNGFMYRLEATSKLFPYGHNPTLDVFTEYKMAI